MKAIIIYLILFAILTVGALKYAGYVRVQVQDTQNSIHSIINHLERD